MSQRRTDYDVIIVGAGLVGLSLARALADTPLRLALIEAKAVQPRMVVGSDMRHIALTRSSQHVFEHLNLWSAIDNHAAPISEIHTSDKGQWGKFRMRADEMQVPALGHVVPMPYLTAALYDAVKSQANVTWYCPAELVEYRPTAQHSGCAVTLLCGEEKQPQTLQAALLVGADGTHSPVRSQLGISAKIFDYAQHALVTTVTVKAPKPIAYERFTAQGLVALLPLGASRYALILCLPPQMAQQWHAASEAEFLTFLQTHFGYALGRFMSVSKRMCFPLKRTLAEQHIASNAVLLGNSAQTLHPIAGQGFNLALRDAAALAEVLTEAEALQTHIGSPEVLQRYVDWRRADQQRVLRFTDGTTRLFVSDFFALKHARSLGLFAADVLPPLKQHLARRAMGFYGRMPKLACEFSGEGARHVN